MTVFIEMLFFCFAADGFTYNLGIFLVEFKVAFNVGSEATSWIASILSAVTLGSGK